MNKLTGNIHLHNIVRYFLVLFKFFILALLVVGLADCKNPGKGQKEKEPVMKEGKQGGVSESGHLTIKPVEPYIFQIQFQDDSLQQFRLWFPEVAIFDRDTSRAAIDEVAGEEWFKKTSDGFLVTGTIGNSYMRVDFKYNIRVVSDTMIKLELEVKNTGKLSWSDYAHLAACLAPVTPVFSDKAGDRTYIETEYNLLSSLIETGVVDDFNHYPVIPRTDLTDSVQRVQVVSGFVSRLSRDEKTNISFCWDKAARVDVNPGGLDCIHSAPAIGPLEPGETVLREGYVLLRKGTVLESCEILRNYFIE
jgi:hypothetical protein